MLEAKNSRCEIDCLKKAKRAINMVHRTVVKTIIFFFLSSMLFSPSFAGSEKYDKYWDARQQILLKTVDPKGLAHWRKWRDQHSTTFFACDWRVLSGEIESANPWKHLSVRIYKTPGGSRRKAGEQVVLKIFDKAKLLYCSDKPGDYGYDELCESQPISVATLDNDKLAILSDTMCLTVFVYRHGKVKKALFATSKNYPEFAYASKLAWDEQGSDLRIITTDVYDNGFASIASIYTWNRTTGAYEHKRVPFEKRFE